DAGHRRARGVSGVVRCGAGDALVGALAEVLRAGDGVDAGEVVLGVERDRDVVVVPAVRVGGTVRASSDRRSGLVDVDDGRAGDAVAGVVDGGARDLLGLAFGAHR